MHGQQNIKKEKIVYVLNTSGWQTLNCLEGLCFV